jgi:hypothetical protein
MGNSVRYSSGYLGHNAPLWLRCVYVPVRPTVHITSLARTRARGQIPCRVGSEFIITLQLAFETDRGNGAAKRSDRGRHGRAVFAISFSWSAAERLVNAIVIVIDSELFQLSLQADYGYASRKLNVRAINQIWRVGVLCKLTRYVISKKMWRRTFFP